MADLAKFQQETTAAYQPAYTSLQNQLGQLDKKLQSSYADIDKQYNTRLTDINSARNDAAYESSIAAAANGGGFGGRGDIAREKYYQRTFVPAMRAAASDKNSAYKAAQEARDNSYDSLSNQLAQLQAEANRYALQRYDAAVEAERQATEAERNRQAQLAASRATNNALSYLSQGGGGSQGWNSPYSFTNGKWYNNQQGYNVKAGTVAYEIAKNTGMSYNDALKQVLTPMAKAGDSGASAALTSLLGTGFNYERNSGKNFVASDNSLLDRLGIRIVR